MTQITWDKQGERLFETGIDHGVLYIPDETGAYENGYAWNGLTSVSESPSGAEANAQYADNIKYLNLISNEEFGATIEAFTYPDEFAQCDGTAVIDGVQLAQQTRRSFGFSYRTLIGNDLVGTDYGYKLHLIYGCDAAPSEKSRSTVNDSPEAATFSWEISTTPAQVVGNNPITGKPFRPTSHLTVDSTQVAADRLKELEDILYGTPGVDPRMPTPNEVLAMISGSVATVRVVNPTYNSSTKTITIPNVPGLIYEINGSAVSGDVTITEDTVVTVKAAPGYKLEQPTDDDWLFEA